MTQKFLCWYKKGSEIIKIIRIFCIFVFCWKYVNFVLFRPKICILKIHYYFKLRYAKYADLRLFNKLLWDTKIHIFGRPIYECRVVLVRFPYRQFFFCACVFDAPFHWPSRSPFAVWCVWRTKYVLFFVWDRRTKEVQLSVLSLRVKIKRGVVRTAVPDIILVFVGSSLSSNIIRVWKTTCWC